MKTKLTLGIAALLLASMVRADSVSTSVGSVFVPNGSTITSVQQVPGELPYTFIVDFTFADGGGSALTEGMSSTGTINFTTSVADLSFTGFGVFWLTDNLGDEFIYEDLNGGPATASGTFRGPGITSIGWQAVGEGSGIDSMSYALGGPSSLPEPSSLLLSGMGLAALISLARRGRMNGRKAMV